MAPLDTESIFFPIIFLLHTKQACLWQGCLSSECEWSVLRLGLVCLIDVVLILSGIKCVRTDATMNFSSHNCSKLVEIVLEREWNWEGNISEGLWKSLEPTLYLWFTPLLKSWYVLCYYFVVCTCESRRLYCAKWSCNSSMCEWGVRNHVSSVCNVCVNPAPSVCGHCFEVRSTATATLGDIPVVCVRVLAWEGGVLSFSMTDILGGKGQQPSHPIWRFFFLFEEHAGLAF